MPVDPLPKLSDIQTIVPVHEQTWLRVIERLVVMDESDKEVVSKEWYSLVFRVLAFGMVAIPGCELRHAYLTLELDRKESPYWYLSPAWKQKNIIVEVYYGEMPDRTKPLKSFCDGCTYFDSEESDDLFPSLYCVVD